MDKFLFKLGNVGIPWVVTIQLLASHPAPYVYIVEKSVYVVIEPTAKPIVIPARLVRWRVHPFRLVMCGYPERIVTATSRCPRPLNQECTSWATLSRNSGRVNWWR